MNLFEEIKHNYLQSNQAVKRIIAINVAVFLVLAILNVFAFLFNSSFSTTIINSYFTLPASLASFLYRPWSIVTYMFLHSGFLHILFNMLWLYWMGNLLQEYLGNKRVYQAYFIGGVFGGLVYMLAYNVFPAFTAVKDVSYALGASAGVLSVVVAAATLLPNFEIRLMFLGSIKLKWIALVSVGLDLISIPNGNAGGHIAHLGGALFGYLFIKHLYTNSVFDRLFSVIGNLFSKKSKLKVHYKTNNNTNKPKSAQTQIDVDEILDKISKSGYESLSKREKEILFKASNH
ncbi:MAG: rhomboid family intramembrane serine protease [Bacteroidia bacterium]|nr:rhomboid family intramembrane serine protease [Bacteroidia bacterium]MBP9688232.1 rhomboid family intramembrane serine protease [Bacteroidia bacterium]